MCLRPSSDRGRRVHLGLSFRGGCVALSFWRGYLTTYAPSRTSVRPSIPPAFCLRVHLSAAYRATCSRDCCCLSFPVSVRLFGEPNDTRKALCLLCRMLPRTMRWQSCFFSHAWGCHHVMKVTCEFRTFRGCLVSHTPQRILCPGVIATSSNSAPVHRE